MTRSRQEQAQEEATQSGEFQYSLSQRVKAHTLMRSHVIFPRCIISPSVACISCVCIHGLCFLPLPHNPMGSQIKPPRYTQHVEITKQEKEFNTLLQPDVIALSGAPCSSVNRKYCSQLQPNSGEKSNRSKASCLLKATEHPKNLHMAP